MFKRSAWLCSLLTPLALAVHAGNVAVPNASFEAPLVPMENPFATPIMEEWQKTPQPGWYDSSANGPWEFLIGTFFNVPNPGTFIDNADGQQAAFLFALPGAGLFQDYNSLSGTNLTPSHAFNATFEVGSAYDLTVGVIGGGGNMLSGVTLQVGLYYRDAASNLVVVAATTATNSATTFPNNTHLVDFQVHLPTVRAADAWAGQHIGVQILSTTAFELAGGYWDLDNVRLVKTLAPNLLNPTATTNKFTFTVQSEAGRLVEIFSSTNLLTLASNWTSLGTFTNFTGSTNFTDSLDHLDQRFYRAQAR